MNLFGMFTSSRPILSREDMNALLHAARPIDAYEKTPAMRAAPTVGAAWVEVFGMGQREEDPYAALMIRMTDGTILELARDQDDESVRSAFGHMAQHLIGMTRHQAMTAAARAEFEPVSGPHDFQPKTF